MQGYILNLRPHREEDLIVTLLTKEALLTLYRFYGARHSPIGLGHKVDFVAERSPFHMGQMRHVVHLGWPWLADLGRIRVWQQFVQLLFHHLKGAQNLDSFYYELLEEAVLKLRLQNPKRVLLESYIKLLEHEGRLHSELICLVCEEAIEEDMVALARAFVPAHSACLYAEGFERTEIARLFESKESLLLEDGAIERLWRLVGEGF
jgi:recombinational DNA repair protein (RecF pathway)